MLVEVPGPGSAVTMNIRSVTSTVAACTASLSTVRTHTTEGYPVADEGNGNGDFKRLKIALVVLVIFLAIGLFVYYTT